MSVEITMPKLSDTMTEGLFACWKKNIGDRIERGDIIAEVETDKSVMDLEAFASGILIKIMVQGGENVPVGTVLGLIGEAGDMGDQPASGTVPGSITPITPITPETVQPLSPPSPESAHPDEPSSPLVRRLAREQGIDLKRIKGSGSGGRITEDDLGLFTSQQQRKPESAASTPIPPAAAPAPSAENVVMTTPLRQAIASTVTRSWQTIPHFSVTVEIDMDASREVISELKGSTNPIGYNSLIIKACAGALLKFPLLCSGGPARSQEVHISFAVSKPGGVMMPVIRGCQGLSVYEIESESSRLADKVRIGRLGSDEMEGGAFSVSNLGMYSVDEFTALIIPGQTAILAVGAVIERPVVRNGQLAVAATMRVTLSSDHRIVDGVYAALFLTELRSKLEKPVSLLL